MYNITVLTEMELTSTRHNKYKTVLEEQLNGFIALHVNAASFDIQLGIIGVFVLVG